MWHGNNLSTFPERQRGAALLVLMLITFLATTSWILAQSNATSARAQFDKTTASALAQAKEALIGRAAMDENRPGSLTCPDVDDNGVADGDFGDCDSLVGRLPWKTLDVPELFDGNGERLWYALSFKLRDHNDSSPINPQQALQLTLDGTPDIAAIVFSPGPPQSSQSGRPSNTITDYLEGSNSDGDDAYVSGPMSPNFNDKVLAIVSDELFRTVNQRVLAEIRGPDDAAPATPPDGLRGYHTANGFFPWADSGNDGNGDVGTTAGSLPFNELVLPLGWLNLNGWLPLITYERMGANSARISIGSSQMNIAPCPSSPCP